MYATRKLESPEALAHFARLYQRRAGHAVDVHYLAGATVRGLFDSAGELVGGVVINTRRPFRYLSALDPALRDSVLPHPHDTCESTCLWLERHVPRAARVMMYLGMLLDVRATGRRWFLGGATNAPLARHYARAGMALVYEGRAQVDDHDVSAWLYVSTIGMALRGALRGVWSYLRRPTQARVGTRNRVVTS